MSMFGVSMSESDMHRLAEAVKAGGGLGHSEKLKWSSFFDKGGAMVRALAAGAPFAQTLRCLMVDRLHDSVPLHALLSALGRGAFPRLKKLTVYGPVMDAGMVRALKDALLQLDAQGVASPLRKLRLSGHFSSSPA